MRNSAYARFFYPHHFFPLLMGFTYRKSINLGPFRVNLSMSGFGYSAGGRGFRVGTTPRGRKSAALCNPSFKIHHHSPQGACAWEL
jgi:hypothetical protein